MRKTWFEKVGVTRLPCTMNPSPRKNLRRAADSSWHGTDLLRPPHHCELKVD